MKMNDKEENNNNLDRGVLLETKAKTKKPSMYSVLLLNDDYTPMEFVVLVLESVFNKKEEEKTSKKEGKTMTGKAATKISIGQKED